MSYYLGYVYGFPKEDIQFCVMFQELYMVCGIVVCGGVWCVVCEVVYGMWYVVCIWYYALPKEDIQCCVVFQELYSVSSKLSDVLLQ